MSFKNLKIGSRMLLGFVLVVLVFAMVTGFVLYEVDGLGSLQKDMARRTHDSLDIDEIALHAEEIYAVIADAVINRNVTETKEEFAKVKAQAEKDIKTVHSLVDHPEEVAMANEYETAMRQYMGLFESQLFPIVEKGASIEARMRDSLAIGAISLRLEQVYAVMADAMINRDLEATKKEWAVIKEQAEKDIAEVGKLVDTDAERAKAAEFGTHYRKYLELFETKTLPILAKGESVEGRMRDSLAIGGISLRLEQVYAVMADAVINRDLAATEKNWLEIKQAAFEDLSKVDQLVDTDAERKLAGDFAESYQEYLNIFENQLLPFLKGDEADNWAAIRDYDEKIDQARDKALQALSAINKSLEGETMEKGPASRRPPSRRPPPPGGDVLHDPPERRQRQPGRQPDEGGQPGGEPGQHSMGQLDRPWRNHPRPARRPPRSSRPSTRSPSRPTCWPSTRRWRRPGPARPAPDSRWWPTRCATWPCGRPRRPRTPPS
jgi:hypothetical protein